MMATRIRWTRFTDKSATHKRELDHSWSELGDHILNSGPFAAKALCPWIKLAEFGDKKTMRGSLRNSQNIVSIIGVEGDYDGEQMQPAQAISLLERAGIKALVYTSPSHRPEAPRWRVLAPLSHSFGPEARTALLARLNGALGGVLSGESFTLSQSYYYGRVQGQAEYLVNYTYGDSEDGAFLDELDELDEIAVYKKPPLDDQEPTPAAGGIPARVEALGRRLRTGDGRRELLKTHLGNLSRRGLTADEIGVLAQDVCNRFFDHDDPVDWSNVYEMITSFASNDARQRADTQSVVGEFIANLHKKPEGSFKLVRAAVDFTKLRPTKWVLEGFVAAGELAVWAGQPGVGKSTVFAGLALVICGLGAEIGSDLANDRPRRVLIVSEHVGQYERIFFGFCHEFGLNPVVVAERIVLFDAVRLSYREIGREITHILGGPEVEPPLVVLDTASASFDLVDENSNAEVAAMMSAIKRPVAETGAPLWVAGHAAKALGREDSEITPRGASAYIGDAHGTGSVFRDKNIPDSVFLKSLKNRSSRQFSEIEVKTQVVAHMVTDERGISKQELIRIGVPTISNEGDRARIADAGKEAQAEAAQMAADIVLTDAIKKAVLGGTYPTRRSVCAAVPMRAARVLERIQEMLASGDLVERAYPLGVKTHHSQKAFLALSCVSRRDADQAQKEYRNAL